ncbi:CapA family protein [Sedimentisphaera salicampi]|uniref:Capsule biosynthesis protein CapA n=1 Tax=Sedimentisphaera salicampi TaxID=1941349 RepID=A0A1W6LKP0_9BACT|nr:CapA family protein [Sedimentisphaera salicampi]ARN56294.1 Capsule biosynthesis protein CapA [Sedimentisphaera salicampi]
MNILIAGDFCPTYGSNQYPDEKIRPEDIFTDFLPEIQKADYAIVNLECPLTQAATAIEKCGPNLKAGRLWADLLKDAGFDMASLANNHIMDFGSQGLSDTLGECDRVGLDAVGAGDNLEHASKTFYKEIEGVKLAVLNFAENEFASAEQDKAGAHPMNVVQNSRKIMEAKKQADFVLVIIHGGHEHCHYPSPRMVEQYRFCADMGADAVICHHTHCIGGLEEYNGVPIAYSLGNFFFPSGSAFDGWRYGYAVRLELEAGEDLAFEIIPYSQCLGGEAVELLAGQKKKEMTEQILSIGKQIQDGSYLQHWQQFVSERCYAYLYNISSVPRLVWGAARRLGLLPLIFKLPCNNKKKTRVKQNMIRCEAHRDIIIESLKKL